MSETQEEKQTVARPRRTVGLDLHPDSFTAAVLVGNTAQDAVVDKVSDALPLSKLEDWFLKNTAPDCITAIEASGNTFCVVDRLAAIGRPSIVLDSTKAGRVSKSYCVTDKVSAVKIGRIYLSGLSDDVYVPDSTTRERRNVCTAYGQAKTDAQRAINRAKGFLNERSIRVNKTVLRSPSGRAMLFEQQDWSPTERAILEQHFADYEKAHRSVRHWRSVMAEDILSDKSLLEMTRLYGLRHITVYYLAAYVGQVSRFLTPKKLVAYIGLNPRVHQSGEKDFTGSLAGHGRRELRSILVEAAHTVFFHKNKSNPLYSWGWKLDFRKGRKAAAIAVARKIVTALWYLLMGRFTELKEANPNLRLKIQRLVAECSEEFIRKHNVKTKKELAKRKIDILLKSA